MGKNFSANNVSRKRNKNDFYQTPYSMTQQLLENVVFDINYGVLEPSCGDKAISKVLEKNGYSVVSKDIVLGDNFLNESQEYDYIITNPPFSLAKEFIQKCREVCKKKFALLLPLAYLHGETRYQEIFSERKLFPLTEVHVFTRYPMLSSELREDGKYHTGMMVYAWFVFEKLHSEEEIFPIIKWISNQRYILSKKDMV